MSKVATRISTAPAVTTLPVEDLRRARAFYEDTLGLDVRSRDDMPEELFVRAGGESLLLLYDRGRGGSGDATAVTFEVDDLAAAVSELRDRGVRFEEYDFPGLKTVDGIASREADRAAWFRDTENNILCLHQDLG